MELLCPIKLIPPLKDYIWGGTKLITKFNKKTKLDTVAESWELACHADGMSVIGDGDAEGMTLADYITSKGREVLGTRAVGFQQFPILIKLIDAREDLSVQVHPDDAYARRYIGEHGKTEFWYIVSADEGASLLYGFAREVTREEVRRRIAENTLDEVCNRVVVKPGDTFMIEAGTLHSIGAGIVIAEIQQNSNTTYRLYDYGRLGRDGKPRRLEIEKALDVLRLAPAKNIVPRTAMDFFAGFSVTELVSCEFFTAYHVRLSGECPFEAGSASFHSLLMLDGNVRLDYADGSKEIAKGDSLFVPAGLGRYRVTGDGDFILSMI